MHKGNDLTIGTYPAAGEPIRLSRDARGKHLYVVGSTGAGKSKFLESLIRQDIMAWPHSGSGLMLLDPHGKLFDDVMRFVAASDLRRWPIVPIDLRRGDWVVSYNLLRRREGGDPAVVIANFVRAIMHAWGQANTNDTPRLAKWLRAILFPLYEKQCTLAEALLLVRSPELRRAITADVQDAFARTVWEAAGARKESDFLEEVESTVNRIRKFLSTQAMRASLCQSEVSLDLGWALERGAIVLVSLATEGGQIDEEDATTFGTLLLSDLWTAAKARGKREGVKPFYVYLDEFQEFITPAMAKTLDQARGFGLHMTLSHQFPSQLLAHGESGKMVWHSVMANARNKVVFQLDHPDDLPALVLWLFRGQVDTDQVKYQHYSTKVLGYQVNYLPSYSTSVSEGESDGWQESHTDGTSHGPGTNWSHSDGTSHSRGENWSHTDGSSHSTGTNRSHTAGSSRGSATSRSRTLTGSESLTTGDGITEGETAGESNSEGSSEGESQTTALSRSISRGRNRSSGRNNSHTDSESFALGGRYMDIEEEEEAFDERVEDPRSARLTWTRGSSDTAGETQGESESSGESEGRSDSAGSSLQRSRGRSRSTGTSLARSRNQARARGTSTADGNGESQSLAASISHTVGDSETHTLSSSDTVGGSETWTESASDSVGGSESWGDQSSDTRGRNGSTSNSRTQGQSMSPMLMPILGREASAPMFRNVEEQLFRFSQFLAGQPDRHFVAKLAGSAAPLSLVTATVRPWRATLRWVERWTVRCLERLGFAIPMQEALRRLAEREQRLTKETPTAAERRADNGSTAPAVAEGNIRAQGKRRCLARKAIAAVAAPTKDGRKGSAMFSDIDLGQMARWFGLGLLALIVLIAILLAATALAKEQAMAEAEERVDRLLAGGHAELAAKQRAFLQHKRQAESELLTATPRAVAQAKAEVMASLSGLIQPPAEARVVHTLRGKHLSVQFSLARRGDAAWVGIAWSVDPEPSGPFFVHLHRGERFLHRDASGNNMYAEPLKPGHHRYVIKLRQEKHYPAQEVTTEELQYSLPVISEKEMQSWLAPKVAPVGESQTDRDCKLRDNFRAVINRLVTVTDVKQECCKEIKMRGYASDDEEWMLNQVDALAQTILGDGDFDARPTGGGHVAR